MCLIWVSLTPITTPSPPENTSLLQPCIPRPEGGAPARRASLQAACRLPYRGLTPTHRASEVGRNEGTALISIVGLHVAPLSLVPGLTLQRAA